MIDLHEMKARLEAKRAELQEAIGSQTEAYPTPVDPVELSDGSAEIEDRAVDFLEMQKEQSLLVNEQALLTEVRWALKRIRDGTYGWCIVCGRPIPARRLEAIPWAALCLEDEERLERHNLRDEGLS